MTNKKLVIQFVKSKLNSTFRSYQLQRLALDNYVTPETLQREFRHLKSNGELLKEGITIKEHSRISHQIVWEVNAINPQFRLEL